MPKATLTKKALNALDDFDQDADYWEQYSNMRECEDPELPDVGDISDQSRYDREARQAERDEALQWEAEFRRKSKAL
jgi:hypothetical protein